MGPELGGAVAPGSGYAIASAASCAIMLMVGFLVLTRNPQSLVNRSFMGLVAACCLWMGGRAGVFGSLTLKEAEAWYYLSFAGLAFLPSTVFLFAAAARAEAGRRLKIVIAAFTLSAGLCILHAVAPEKVATVVANPYTGWYPRYSTGGYVLVGSLGVAFAYVGLAFMTSRVSRSSSRAVERKRMRVTLVGLALCATACFDFLPALGSPLPPIGHFSLLVGIAFFGYALGRYRIVILTPTTAGNAIARTMQEGLLFLDLDGNILFTNAALCGLLKYTDDELRGRPVDVLFPEGGKPDLDLGPQGRGLPVARPVRLRTRTGETVPVMLRLGPHFDEEGDTAGFVGLALVQEGELRLAGRVRELEAQIETILHTSLFGVYAVSEGRFQFVNEKTAEMLGYPKEELVGMPIDQIIHPDDLDGVKGRIARRELGDTSDNHHVFRVVNRQGQTRQIEVHGMSVPKDGRHTVFGFAVDVTARAENEREMGRARRLSEWLLERAPVGVLVTDLEGWVTRANARACEFLGEPSAEALQGRHLADTPLGRETPLAQWFSGDPADRDEDGAPADFTACLGSGPALRVAVMPANSMFGTAHGLVALLDLAEPPAAHGGRPQSPAMEDVAEWAALVVGGMARDLEAHLGGILGYSSLARALLPGEEKVTQYVDAIMHSAQRSLEVTSRFAALRRGGGREPAPFPLLTVLEDVVRRARDRLGEHVDVGLSVPENLPSIEGDRHLLEEALFQLATVSAAPGSRGRLDFSAATFDWTGSTTGDVQDLTPGAYLSVEIRSSQGPLPIDLPASGRDSLGMRSPAQARAGMGLWFARYVIQDHRGALSVSEGPESGWACRLWLPVPGTGSERAPRGTRSAEQAQGRVMIVDDEASVREVGSELLEEMGYSVLTAQDGQAALDILQHHPGVEVVILDMVMPRLDGEHTFFRLRELDPGIRVVISSGFTEDEKVSRLLEEGAVAFVQKPYRVQTLADAVEEAMARRDST